MQTKSKMETKICKFEENEITFLLSKENSMMVNATQMAKVFNSEVAHFMANEGTKRFVNACLNTRNSEYINISKESDLFRSNQKSGTFMHRILALKFAAWLSPDFEVWVYSTIEKLLFGKHVEREQSLERTVALKSEMLELTGKPDKTGEDFDRYLAVEQELKREQALRQQLTRETVTEMQTLFTDEPA
jgi:hypothetical protein